MMNILTINLMMMDKIASRHMKHKNMNRITDMLKSNVGDAVVVSTEEIEIKDDVAFVSRVIEVNGMYYHELRKGYVSGDIDGEPFFIPSKTLGFEVSWTVLCGDEFESPELCEIIAKIKKERNFDNEISTEIIRYNGTDYAAMRMPMFSVKLCGAKEILYHPNTATWFYTKDGKEWEIGYFGISPTRAENMIGFSEFNSYATVRDWYGWDDKPGKMIEVTKHKSEWGHVIELENCLVFRLTRYAGRDVFADNGICGISETFARSVYAGIKIDPNPTV